MPALFIFPLCFLSVPDIGLCVAYNRAKTQETSSRYLVELSRRDGPIVISFLTFKHGEIANSKDESGVELLTALRRSQRKPDPIQVVTNVPGEVESIFPNLPVIEAAIINRDFRKLPVTFTDGGDYRGGRQGRWRFNVSDAQGKVLPVKPHQRSTLGGIYSMGVLEHEETWETTLHMQQFIDLPPGDYKVVVEYHDRETIGDRPDTAGLLVCRSEPFKVHVQPRVIDVTKKDRETVREAVIALDDKRRVKILQGVYSKDAHEFIKPDSAEGRLLALGWRAVPTLLDALDDDKISEQRRAWVFATLFSLTGWNDPRHKDGILAGYENREGGWVVSGGRGGKAHAMGMGLGGSSSSSGGTLDPVAQKKFATGWKAFREYLIVREKP